MINPQLFRLILRQAKKKKLGHVLCLGRQRIDISRQRFIDSCVAENVATPSDLPNQIDDIFLFNFLGARSLQSMDVNSNEGAEIIHNLNLPVKKSLHGRFDTIVDGGTFDHLFDLKTAFANINKLLKVGGRVIQWNAASNYTGICYLQFSPDIFWDFYKSNGYSVQSCNLLLSKLEKADEKTEVYKWTGINKLFIQNLPAVIYIEAKKTSKLGKIVLPIQSFYRGSTANFGKKYTEIKESFVYVETLD